jgi:hypothetical protein
MMLSVVVVVANEVCFCCLEDEECLAHPLQDAESDAVQTLGVLLKTDAHHLG